MKTAVGLTHVMKIILVKGPLIKKDHIMEIFSNETAFKLQNEFLVYQTLKWGFKNISYSTFYTGWGKSRFTVVCMENSTIINKQWCKNKLVWTQNCKPTFAQPCILYISGFSIGPRVMLHKPKWTVKVIKMLKLIEVLF